MVYSSEHESLQPEKRIQALLDAFAKKILQAQVMVQTSAQKIFNDAAIIKRLVPRTDLSYFFCYKVL